MLAPVKKNIFVALGFFFVLLAFVGLFLPLLPTTPFALLAAYFFSRSNEKFLRWLMALPALGPLILNWEKHKTISLKAKFCATLIMLIFLSWSFYRVGGWFELKVGISLIMTGVLAFIWSRPSSARSHGH